LRLRRLSIRASRAIALVLLCAPIVLGPAVLVVAQETPDVPGYRDAIDEALAEYAAHNYREARSLFARAHKLSPNARTLRGLGAVCFELREYAESTSFLEQALVAQQRPLEGTVRSETERLLARARGFIAEIELVVAPREALVTVDGKDVPVRAGTPLRLAIGAHEIELRADGYRSDRRHYTAEGGERETWTISLREHDGSDSSSASPTPPLGRRPSARRIALGSAIIALGLGGYAATVVLSLKRHDRARTFHDALVGGAEYGPRYDAWKSARRAPYVLDAAAATLVTSGALVLLLSADRQALPWWASLSSAAAGIGLAAWGLSELVQGAPCHDDFAPGRCVDAQESLDRGALISVATVPFLALPLAQLGRRLVGPSPPRTARRDRSESSREPVLSLIPQRMAERGWLLAAQLRWL